MKEKIESFEKQVIADIEFICDELKGEDVSEETVVQALMYMATPIGNLKTSLVNSKRVERGAKIIQMYPKNN